MDTNHMEESYFSVIFCVGPKGEFGYGNSLPWKRMDSDMNRFRTITSNSEQQRENIVIMGRKTYESIGKPLDGRINIVISTSLKNRDTINVVSSLKESLILSKKLIDDKKGDKVFLIGGSKLILEAIYHPNLEYVYETRINTPEGVKLLADCYLNINYNNLQLTASNTIREENNFIIFKTFKNRRDGHPENAYLGYMSAVLERGQKIPNRTGIDCVSIIGNSMEIEMSKYGFPLYTTKRVPFKGVLGELLFFISGKSQTKVLEEQGIKIWTGNTSREFLDKRNLHKLEEGNMGEGYGHQWRHFGYDTTPNEEVEIGQGGYDQLREVIENIKKVKLDPTCEESRRLIVTAWNPISMKKAVLPCCHLMFMFSVREGYLNISVIMRSNDVFLGNPWNVSSYSLLTYMICYLTDLVPGKLTLFANDCHIYSNHLEQVKIQLNRCPRRFPRLEIVDRDKTVKTIDDFKPDNFVLHDYNPHPTITGKMAI